MTDRNANRPGYQKTKVGWIPEEWEVKRLSSVTTIIMGQSPDSSFYNKEEDGLPLIQGMSDVKDGKTEPRYWTSQITRECQPNDIILSVRAPVGSIARSLHHGCIGRGVCVIRSKKSTDYIYQLLRYMEPVWVRYSQGSTFEAVVSKDVKQFLIPVPPLHEQQKIAEILSTWDRAIEETQKLIDAKQQLKKGLMQQLLTGRMRFPGFGAPVEKAGELPGGWEEKRLGEVGEIYNGLSGKSKDDFGQGEPFIPYMNILNNSRVDMKQVNLVKIGSDEHQNQINYGDVLFTSSSETPDEICMSSVFLSHQKGYYLNSFCFGFRFFDSAEIAPEFARFFFRGPVFRRKIIPLGQGFTRYNISKKSFVKIMIGLPDIEEQKRIADLLTAIEEELRLLKTCFESYLAQKEGLLQALLMGWIRT